MDRREALARLGGIVAGGWLGARAVNAQTTATLDAATTASATAAPKIAPGQPLSLAHITDVHIIDQYESEKWVARALKQIQSHQTRPQLIVNTGDCIMDSLRKSKDVSLRWWKLWNDTFSRENSLLMHTCLGNHDVWGGRMPADTPLRSDPDFGKKLAMDQLGMSKRYYSVDAGNWRIIMLDSIFPQQEKNNLHWIGKLDDEQMQWLKQTVRNTPADRHILVGSHVPIIQVCAMWDKPRNENGSYTIGPRSMMSDSPEIAKLFAEHPNVKLCLSGHVHRLDRIQLHHTTYICGGALSGAKWRRTKYKMPNGFGITRLNPDGTFEYNYESIGWKKGKGAV